MMSKSIFLNKLTVIVWIKSKIFYLHLRQDNKKILFVLFRGPLTLACTFVPVRYIHCTVGWVVFAFFEFHKKSWVCGSLGMYIVQYGELPIFLFCSKTSESFSFLRSIFSKINPMGKNKRQIFFFLENVFCSAYIILKENQI